MSSLQWARRSPRSQAPWMCYVMSADQQGKGQPDPDWLTEWDAWAADAEPFQNFDQWSYFFVVRYPKLLRPFGRYYAVVLPLAREMVHKVRPLCVTKGLSLRQCIQLGALLFDIDADYQYNDEQQSHNDEQQSRHELHAEAAEQGGGRVSRLNGKLKNAADALDKVADHIDEIHRRFPIPASVITRRTGRSSVARDDAARYRLMMMADDEIPLLQAVLDGIAQPHPEFKRRPQIKREAMIQLTSFFVTECDISQTEADIRTAKIGNLLWGWDYAIRETYDGVERFRGVDAVRSQRRRKPPPSS